MDWLHKNIPINNNFIIILTSVRLNYQTIHADYCRL